jgi:CubicO group peptidase (beta-lactamase class C family)
VNVVREVFEAAATRWRVPGIAYGVVRDGELATSGGIGTLALGAEVVPDADSVFRIASMTKSFTAAAVMRLIGEGRLSWDRAVAEIAPELAGWRGPTTDAPAPTLRHLLTMDAGLPTDDPWADRHLDATAEQMDAWFAAGASFAWSPGVAFEYSNLGWGLLGRIVERATGSRVQDLVAEHLLAPLGMTSTAWVREALPPGAAVADGHGWRDGAFVDVGPPIGDGGIAPMGGLWTTVRDLARWVAFFLDAFPPRDDPDDAALPRAARREMQQLRRLDGAVTVRPRPDGPSRVVAAGYGLGLFVSHDPRLGHVVAHSGGLPGFGSHMRWLPERGFGVIALANATYAPMSKACAWALDALADAGELPPARRVSPAPELAEAATRAAALLDAWDDDAADDLFADNVDLDEPRERRRALARALRERLGPMTWDGHLEAETSLRGSLPLAGGRVRVELGLNAERPPRLQWLDVTDRTRPDDAPVIADRTMLSELPRFVVVVVRPVGDLADRFARIQESLLDRFPHIEWRPPRAHATIGVFGSSKRPLEDGPERVAREVAERWAATTPPLRLELEGLDVFDDDPAERIPIMRLRSTDALRAAVVRLRTLGAEAGLPPGEAHAIDPERWVFHLSLAYPREVEPVRWAEVVAWARALALEGAACEAEVADVLAFGLGSERAFGRYELSG